MLEKLNSESGSPIIEIKLIISTTMHIINKSKDLSKIAWELMPMIGLKVQYINFPFFFYYFILLQVKTDESLRLAWQIFFFPDLKTT